MKRLILLAILTACGGDSATSGLTISSNELIAANATDFCTEFVDESCFFTGGQIVRFSDGSIFINGSLFFLYDDTNDTDSDNNNFSFIVPGSTNAAHHRISHYVARGTGYNSLYLAYTRSPETLTLIYDTNGNESIDASDTGLATLTTSSW